VPTFKDTKLAKKELRAHLTSDRTRDGNSDSLKNKEQQHDYLSNQAAEETEHQSVSRSSSHEEYFPAVHKGATRVGKVTHLVLLQAEPEGVCIPLFSYAITPKSLCTRKRLRKIFRNPMITFASLSCLSK
jgi:hypothetical protein